MAGKKIKGTLPGRTYAVGPGGLDARGFARWYRGQITAQWEGLDLELVGRMAAVIVEAQAKGRTIYVIGDGGSAASASHIAVDFSKTAARTDQPLVRCLSLCDNNAFITAVGNDISFDAVFSRQLENILKPGDVVLMLSGSGNSPNLISAAKFAKARRAKTLAWLGFDGGKLKSLADLALLVPSDQYGVIEDMHMSLAHIITFYLKQKA
ncbi:MAG: SIS domain-containing protein [Elusimicrobia bacterium]|nr:SIS domain-containing protein [Elusimicrobiota bacterium]